jgi:hypothetical protein
VPCLGLTVMLLASEPSPGEDAGDERKDLVMEAWLTRAQKRVAMAWLQEQRIADEPRNSS